MLRKRSPFTLYEYGVRRGQEHWEHWDWEDTADWTDRTGPGQADMDGQNGSSGLCSRPHGTVTDGEKKKKKVPDRVTLKKEIGLLSACTIIIGEPRGRFTVTAQLSRQLGVVSEFLRMTKTSENEAGLGRSA